MIGIVSYGGYIPRYRLNRALILKAMGWMAPGNAGLARGEKAVAAFDEDPITMAVAAGMDALQGFDRSLVDAISFASTSMPFKERQNAGIIKEALGLKDQVGSADFCSGIKGGTTALLNALNALNGPGTGTGLVCAADIRLGKPASPQEMIFGDGAAAFLVGRKDVIAELKGSFCTSHDFVDHYRGEFARFDRQWEDRWIRDMGLTRIIPEAINGFLAATGMKMADFSKVVYPCHYSAARKQINKMFGIAPEVDQNHFQTEIGETGTPHVLIMLANALETASPGDKILVIGFGNGCDVLSFEVTDQIRNLPARKGVSGSLANRRELDSYTKYLVWRDILTVDAGLRMEEDLWTRWSALWRKRKEVLGLIGSRCLKCGTAQYPPQRVCVNAECGAIDNMEDYGFADKTGTIASYTSDNLAASIDPPAKYGQIEFAEGGKFMFDLTDCDPDDIQTGMSVSLSFRRKYHDSRRDISGYFWKAVPMIKEN
ncbi:OB-fold domain-containing protein [bacterium]|nr:OB-fold domain-containing protein [bacterium]